MSKQSAHSLIGALNIVCLGLSPACTFRSEINNVYSVKSYYYIIVNAVIRLAAHYLDQHFEQSSITTIHDCYKLPSTLILV